MLQIVVPAFDEVDVVRWVSSAPTKPLGSSISVSATYVKLPATYPCEESFDVINSGAYTYAFLPIDLVKLIFVS